MTWRTRPPAVFQKLALRLLHDAHDRWMTLVRHVSIWQVLVRRSGVRR
jgi:hypothetical protein